jgi:hypothetical protein
MIVDNLTGDSFFAATDMGGVGWIEGSFKGEMPFFVRTFSHDKNLTK